MNRFVKMKKKIKCVNILLKFGDTITVMEEIRTSCGISDAVLRYWIKGSRD